MYIQSMYFSACCNAQMGIKMIFDAVTNLRRYKGIYTNLDIAINYLLEHDLSKIDIGQYDIVNKNVYMNVTNSKLQVEKESFFELHQRYLDLHIDILGRERVLFAQYLEENLVKQYDKETDYALMRGKANVSCELDQEHFLICMLREPHLPCIKIDNEEYVKKAVLKIAID